MSIIQTLTTSFKVELLQGIHNFDADQFKIALYYSTATLNADTTAYTPAGETVGTGYTASGQNLTVSTTPTAGGTTTAYVEFDTVTWAGATFEAAGALIYNYTKADRSVAVLSFGGTKISAGGPFIIQFPTATATTAIIRIA